MKRDLKIYNLIENWKPGVQNPTASADGRDVTLVLDGHCRRFFQFMSGGAESGFLENYLWLQQHERRLVARSVIGTC